MDLEFATTTRTGKLLELLRGDTAKIRNGSPSAEWRQSLKPRARALRSLHRPRFTVAKRVSVTGVSATSGNQSRPSVCGRLDT
jgi:hypothetical protein